ncbi:BOI-related E3 ubiquitin-protein ligase 1 [Cardamine amara subsp. amara]|uniref:BOI-related E3 ubiquitin-protein ligase 1 n=1 Tax=Cardamine amara subsp. amara TaxID=228776 RepID=A0ABD1BIH3_CARAN
MAIQAQLNYNASNATQIGFPLISGGSEFSLVNNNGVIGNGNDQLQKDFNHQALFHHQHQNQQYRSQSFLDAHMEKQRQEIDQFIKIQNERLRYVLQEQRKQEIEMILRAMESKAFVLMNQKEEEMSKALSKNMELEDLLRKMEMENQTWQRLARENEAMVQSLNSTLEQVKERAATCHEAGAVAEDEGSFCIGGGDGDRVPAEKKISSSCVNCGSNGVTRVLFLPCRHLCCCTDCEVGLLRCPICNTPKKNKIEAFIC